MANYVHTLHFASPIVGVGEYRCTRTDPAITGPEQVQGNLIIMPQHGLMMKHRAAAEPAVAMDVNHAVFFNEAEVYRVTHPCGCGDAGTTLHLAPELVRGLAERHEVVRETAQAGEVFQPTHVPAEGRDVLLHRAILRTVRDPASRRDRLRIEEAVIALHDRLLERAGRGQRSRAGRRESRPRHVRAGTRRAHRDLVEAAKVHLGNRLAEGTSVAEIARAVHASPHHLCRVFREETGRTLHGYLRSLRLRTALDRLEAGAGVDLLGLGLGLGFSSHSHFSAAFRREFGVPPSRWCDASAAGRLEAAERAIS